MKEINVVIPQGTIACPMLFIIFMNALALGLGAYHCKPNQHTSGDLHVKKP